MERVDRCFADDVVWHAPGLARNAGVRRGKRQLFADLGDLAKLTEGTLRSEIHDVLANDDHVVVLQATHAERDGRPPLEDAEAIVFRVPARFQGVVRDRRELRGR